MTTFDAAAANKSNPKHSIIGSCLVTVGVLAVLVPKWLWPTAVAAAAAAEEPRTQRVVINGDSRIHHQEEPNKSPAVRQK